MITMQKFEPSEENVVLYTLSANALALEVALALVLLLTTPLPPPTYQQPPT